MRAPPNSAGIQIRPATAPDSIIEIKIMRLGLMPLARAALSDCPLARRSKPNRVLLSRIQNPTPTMTAMTDRAQTSPSRGSNGAKPPSVLPGSRFSVWTLLPSLTPCLFRK